MKEGERKGVRLEIERGALDSFILAQVYYHYYAISFGKMSWEFWEVIQKG